MISLNTGTLSRTPCSLDWIEQCFTSPPTQYRLYGRRFLQVKRPNQQYQSTAGTNSTHTNQTHNKQTWTQNTASPLVYNNMGWLGDVSHRGQGCQAWTAVGLPPRYMFKDCKFDLEDRDQGHHLDVVTQSSSSALYQFPWSSRRKRARCSLPGETRHWGPLHGLDLRWPRHRCQTSSVRDAPLPAMYRRRALYRRWWQERVKNTSCCTVERLSPLEQCSYLTQQYSIYCGAVLTVTITCGAVLIPDTAMQYLLWSSAHCDYHLWSSAHTWHSNAVSTAEQCSLLSTYIATRVQFTTDIIICYRPQM